MEIYLKNHQLLAKPHESTTQFRENEKNANKHYLLQAKLIFPQVLNFLLQL